MSTADRRSPAPGLPPVAVCLPARPESVARVRNQIMALAGAAGLEETVLADVGLAVSEACTNVVVHAYAGREPGMFRARAELSERGLEVSIRDGGHGMRPRSDSPGMGLGLPLMASLTTEVAFRPAPGGGTEILMLFAAPEAPADIGWAKTG